MKNRDYECCMCVEGAVVWWKPAFLWGTQRFPHQFCKLTTAFHKACFGSRQWEVTETCPLLSPAASLWLKLMQQKQENDMFSEDSQCPWHHSRAAWCCFWAKQSQGIVNGRTEMRTFADGGRFSFTNQKKDRFLQQCWLALSGAQRWSVAELTDTMCWSLTYEKSFCLTSHSIGLAKMSHESSFPN